MPRLFERAYPLVMHDARPPRDHFAQQIVLAAEVIIGEREIDPGDFGDGAERDAVETGFAEAALGRIENREPRRLATPRAAAIIACRGLVVAGRGLIVACRGLIVACRGLIVACRGL